MSPERRKRRQESADRTGQETNRTRSHIDTTLLAICATLVVMVLLVFGQTARHGFVNYDDDQYVYDNIRIKPGLTSDGLAWMMKNHHVGNWHPVTTLSHMLDCQLFGMEAGGHHVISMLLHAATTVLLLLTLRRMTGALWPSAFVAALFAIHPLRAESVAWVSERKDVLSGLFFVLTLWAYERFARRPFSVRWYLPVVVFTALGLMSKPMLVTLPFVLLLLDFWPLGRWSGPSATRLIVEKIPLLLMAVALGIVTLNTQQITMESTQTLPVKWRIGNGLVSYAAYLGKCFWPFDLIPFYPHPRDTLAPWKPIAALALLGSISAVAIATTRKRPFLLIGWLWYLGMLVPVIGLVQVGSQSMADRYTYLPMVGLWVGLVWWIWTLDRLWSKHRVAVAWVAAVMIVGLMIRAGVQVSCWKNSETLFRHTLACSSGNYTAHLNLANALIARGEVNQAVHHFQKALEIKPDYTMAHNNIGLALRMQGRWDQSMHHFTRALELSPNFVEGHYNLGNAWADRGDKQRALACFRRAIAINPEFAQGHNNLGATLDACGQHDEAMIHYGKAIALRPNYADAQFNYGNALAQKGRLDQAITRWRAALRIDPRYAKAHLQLGTVLYNRRQVNEAIGHLKKAVELDPNLEQARQYLATVLQNEGQLLPTAQNH